MCCFSRPVTSVSATRIFARMVAPGTQALIYQMNLETPEDLAMILPIPVRQPAADDALRFVSLEDYPAIFTDLERGFPKPRSDSKGPSPEGPGNALPLEVHRVGAFDASFVPSPSSFGRLDARFRLAQGVWDALPQYADYGFAVFKLRKGRSEVHPMAFLFPTARPADLFFPTVHIHDGKVHPRERFDHVLYAQAGANALIPRWAESAGTATRFTDTKAARELLAPDQHVYRLAVGGLRENRDITAQPERFGG